ncbi:hypothetical protein ACTHIO_004843 [Escherichia coli]
MVVVAFPLLKKKASGD